MASTSLATPPSSPRKSSFSSLRLSPMKKNLNFIPFRRRSDGEDADLALGGESSKGGTSANDGGGVEGVEKEEGTRTETQNLTVNPDGGQDDESREAGPASVARQSKSTSTPETNSTNINAQFTQVQENSTPVPRRLLGFAHIAELFINLRRAQRRASASNHHAQRHGLVVESCSGEELFTHMGLTGFLKSASSTVCDGLDVSADATQGSSSSSSSKEPLVILKRRARVELADTFMCMDGVDASKLLRATRASLHERAEGLLGSCVFVEESWTCSIYSHKHRHEDGYRVQVRYSATSASLVTATHNPQSPSRASFPSNLPSISEGTERASTPDSPPSRSPPSSPSRKGKKRLSFTSKKSESKTNSSEETPSINSSAATANSMSTPTASPTSPTFPPSPGKSRASKPRSVSFAQASAQAVLVTDVRQPVLLDRARGVPGLMTIVNRETVEFVVAPVQ